jgi:hypothetical protein
LPTPPPVYDSTSNRIPIPIQNQLKPEIPASGDQTIRYIIIVNGANIANSRGQTQEANVTLNRTGLISHQTSIAMRGPKKNNDVIIQHIVFYNSTPLSINTIA